MSSWRFGASGSANQSSADRVSTRGGTSAELARGTSDMDASFAKARSALSVRFIWPATLPGTLWRRLYANTVCHARSVARQRRPLVKRTREGPASRQGEIQKNGESRVHRRRRGAGFRLSGGSGGMRLTTARRVACALYRAVCHIRQLHTMRSCWSAEQPASLSTCAAGAEQGARRAGMHGATWHGGAGQR